MNETRIENLEDRVLELERELAEMRGRQRPSPAPLARQAPPRPAVAAPAPGPRQPRTSHAVREPRNLTLEDVLSPRNLAIAGAIAVLAGLIFLVSYGISNGWISEEVRVLGAAVFAAILAGAGIYLREVRKLATPAEALVVIGFAGMFIALVAATRLYDLIDPVAALVLSGLIGLAGLGIGFWWRSEVVATSILGASLLAPVMVGAEYTPGLLGFLIPVFTAAVVAAVLRRWNVIFPTSAALFLCSLLAAVADAEQGSTLAAYGLALVTMLLVIAGSVGRTFWVASEQSDQKTLIFGFFFSVVTILGAVLVTGSENPLVDCSTGGDGCATHLTAGASIWLLTSTAAGASVWWLARARGQQALSVTAFALGAGALAAALGFIFEGGPLLTAAWAAEAACLIWFGVRRWQRLVGVGALSLAVICALVEVPLTTLGEGSPDLLRDLAVIAPLLVPLVALAWRERNEAGEIGAGLAVVVATWMAVIACGTLTEPTSVLVLVPLGLAAAVPVCLTDRVWTQATLVLFGSIAVVFTVAFALPLDALVNGVPNVLEALGASSILIAIVAATAFFGPQGWRGPAAWTAVGLLIYTVSAVIVDRFQGGTEVPGELSTEAQGQVIVSSLWALSGLGLVVAGLLRQHLNWRKAGLVLLILACVKISLYDLASLSTAGRTISFILVGLVLLAAAFAYQWMNRKAAP